MYIFQCKSKRCVLKQKWFWCKFKHVITHQTWQIPHIHKLWQETFRAILTARFIPIEQWVCMINTQTQITQRKQYVTRLSLSTFSWEQSFIKIKKEVFLKGWIVKEHFRPTFWRTSYPKADWFKPLLAMTLPLRAVWWRHSTPCSDQKTVALPAWAVFEACRVLCYSFCWGLITVLWLTWECGDNTHILHIPAHIHSFIPIYSQILTLLSAVEKRYKAYLHQHQPREQFVIRWLLSATNLQSQTK